MIGMADILTLLIGVLIWQFLKPKLGFGALIIGGIVAYALRTVVIRLFGFYNRTPNIPAEPENTENIPPDASDDATLNCEGTESQDQDVR